MWGSWFAYMKVVCRGDLMGPLMCKFIHQHCLIWMSSLIKALVWFCCIFGESCNSLYCVIFHDFIVLCLKSQIIVQWYLFVCLGNTRLFWVSHRALNQSELNSHSRLPWAYRIWHHWLHREKFSNTNELSYVISKLECQFLSHVYR